MAHRFNQILVSALMMLIIASVASPGLALHNCREFGTKSTQLCACCEAELEASKGCCSKKKVATVDSRSTVDAVGIESACCFVSHELPFELIGQHSTLLAAHSPDITSDTVAPSVDIATSVDVSQIEPTHSDLHRHTSDPPSYLLTHSFRC